MSMKPEVITEEVNAEVVDNDEKFSGKNKNLNKVTKRDKLSNIFIILGSVLLTVGTLISVTCFTVYLIFLSIGGMFVGLFFDETRGGVVLSAFITFILIFVGMGLMLIAGIILYLSYRMKKKNLHEMADLFN